MTVDPTAVVMAVSCNDYDWKASFLLLSYADLAEDQRVNDDG